MKLMKTDVSIRFFIAAIAAFCILAFQNCSKVNFDGERGPAVAKSAVADGDLDGDGLTDDIDDDMDGDGITNEDDEDMDDDGVPNDEDADDDETAEDQANGLRCIGNGIKVPDSSIVACNDGEMKCVRLCVNKQELVTDFKSARGRIQAGAQAGACR